MSKKNKTPLVITKAVSCEDDDSDPFNFAPKSPHKSFVDECARGNPDETIIGWAGVPGLESKRKISNGFDKSGSNLPTISNSTAKIDMFAECGGNEDVFMMGDSEDFVKVIPEKLSFVSDNSGSSTTSSNPTTQPKLKRKMLRNEKRKEEKSEKEDRIAMVDRKESSSTISDESETKSEASSHTRKGKKDLLRKYSRKSQTSLEFTKESNHSPRQSYNARSSSKLESGVVAFTEDTLTRSDSSITRTIEDYGVYHERRPSISEHSSSSRSKKKDLLSLSLNRDSLRNSSDACSATTSEVNTSPPCTSPLSSPLSASVSSDPEESFSESSGSSQADEVSSRCVVHMKLKNADSLTVFKETEDLMDDCLFLPHDYLNEEYGKFPEEERKSFSENFKLPIEADSFDEEGYKIDYYPDLYREEVFSTNTEHTTWIGRKSASSIIITTTKSDGTTSSSAGVSSSSSSSGRLFGSSENEYCIVVIYESVDGYVCLSNSKSGFMKNVVDKNTFRDKDGKYQNAIVEYFLNEHNHLLVSNNSTSRGERFFFQKIKVQIIAECVLKELMEVESFTSVNQKKIGVGLVFAKKGQTHPMEFLSNVADSISEPGRKFLLDMGITNENKNNENEINESINNSNNEDIVTTDSSLTSTTTNETTENENNSTQNDDNDNSNQNNLYNIPEKLSIANWFGVGVDIHIAPAMTGEDIRSLIGNDIAVIIFIDEGEPFNPIYSSEFGNVTQVFIVVQPQEGFYRVGTYSRSTIADIRPRYCSLRISSEDIFNYVVTIAHNGIVKSFMSPPLSRLIEHPRNEAISKIVEKHHKSFKKLSNIPRKHSKGRLMNNRPKHYSETT